MLRLVSNAAREREDAETAASARLLQRWVAAVTRDRVLRGAVVWPQAPKRDSDNRRERTG